MRRATPARATLARHSPARSSRGRSSAKSVAGRFAAAAPNGRARFVPLDGGFHEVLNDTGRDVVVRVILAFWQTQLQP
jgi:alpha-beta hydrolase superfamily lysophospholipase